MNVRIAIAAQALALLASPTFAAQAARPDVRLQSQGQPMSLEQVRKGRAAIVVFWRSDCAPCLKELEQLPRMRREARPLHLILVDLESAQELQPVPAVVRLVSAADSWRALDAPGKTLSAFGGDPPRLPLSVLLDVQGVVRKKRLGELGPQLVREWSRMP